MWQEAFGTEPTTRLATPSAQARTDRNSIQAWLRAAARQCGLPPERIGTHSIRGGGATALVAAGWSQEAARRFGRWTSEAAFRGYLWDTFADTEGLAGRMVQARSSLHAGALMPGTAEAKARGDPARWSAAWADRKSVV